MFRFKIWYVAQHIKAGKLEGLGGDATNALPLCRMSPTAAVAGIPILWSTLAGRCGPKGLTADVRAKLESEFAAAVNSPDVKKQFNDIGFDVVGTNGAQFVEFLASETQRWKKVIDAGNISVD
jgi:tripartite-type tricarboxylate transporter receptor subunit TctC